ncbi:protein SOSEKI 1 [Trifolium pratense]|uniref:protein SOSEKI 1 n=1 Tax=Trifolium pratense TaxID=57577 RepID=UPI001E695F95|nr:protein SOSEKI 1 [Trifolium pratense]
MEAKGGEVRRLHIIYFLSHLGGHAEHPHLIRVLHLTRNGVYLRDIKRWLGELRGKDLPESYAWSYKRRYKSGYVWQDLMDDDLITPISDNEYVLKGSQIHTTPFETHSINSVNEKKNDTDILAEKVKVEEDEQKRQNKPSLSDEKTEIQKETDTKKNNLNQGSSEVSQDSLVFSSDRSSVTDDDSCSKVEEEKLLGNGKEGLIEKNHEKFEAFSLPSLYHNLMSKKGKKVGHNNKTDTTPPDSRFSTPTSSTSSQSQSSFTKIRSNSTRVTSVFRNWIGCGNVATNDAAFLSMNLAQKTLSKETNNVTEKRGEICKGDKLGGSARCFGTPWNYHDQNEHFGARKSCDGEEIHRGRKKLSELMSQTSYKPFGGPFCSQCGKSFKPEKMHKHMKSCKGMKSMGTSTIAEESTKLQRSTSSCKDYLLQN